MKQMPHPCRFVIRASGSHWPITMTPVAENNWGYPTETSFKAHDTPALKAGRASVEDSPQGQNAQPCRLSFQFTSNLRILALFLISAATAAMIIFPLRRQAAGVIERISSAAVQRMPGAARMLPAGPALQTDAPRRAMLYRCGNTWTTSPSWEEECDAVEAFVIRDSHGNQYITQGW